MLNKVLRLDRYGVPSILILVIMVSVGPFGDTEYAPSLPAIAHDLGVRYELAQLTMSVYLAGYALFQLIYGPLSDRFGRKPIVLSGTALFIVGSLLCFLSTSITALLVGRFIQATGVSAGSVICYAAVRDAYSMSERKQVLAKINAIFALAPALGPIVGAFIDDYFGWRMNFLLLVVLSVLMFLSLWLFFPETKRCNAADKMPFKQSLNHYRTLFQDPYYFIDILMMGLAVGIVYSALIGSPAIIVDVLQLPSRWFALIALGVMLGFVVGSCLCHYLSARLSDARLLFTGWMIVLGFIYLTARNYVINLLLVKTSIFSGS